MFNSRTASKQHTIQIPSMKKLLSFALVLAVSQGISQTNSPQDQYTDVLSNSIQHQLNKNSSIPEFIEFKQGKAPSLQQVEGLLNSFAKKPFTLTETKREDDALGFTHIKYQQVINSIPVELSYVTVHMKNGAVHSITGNLTSYSANSTSASVSEEAALKNALARVNAKTYKWEIPEEEEFIKNDQNDPTATFYPNGSLTYFETENGLRLAYKFDIYAHKPVSRADYYVDAQTGKVIFTNHEIHHANSTGVATTGYSGVRTIITDSLSPTSFRLRETGRGLGIETYDMNTGTTYGSAVDFTDNNNVWNTTTNDDQYALDAHWGAEMTYDYFWTVHARNSINGAGFKLRSYVHYDNNYVNAFWDGQRMTYGDGNGTTTSPLTTMAIAGHEITHGLTSNTCLLYTSPSPRDRTRSRMPSSA